MAAATGNKYALGNTGGRPPMFETPEALEEAVKSYFEEIKGDLKEEREIVNPKTGQTQFIPIWNREPEPATITGLALFLGFESRQSFYDYEGNKEFSYTIKKARTRIENVYEKGLHGEKPTGSIFALKNMGWVDQKELKHSGSIANEPPTILNID